MSIEGWLWLSFANDEFLGVTIVEIPPRNADGLSRIWAKRALAGHPDPFGPVSDGDYGFILALDRATELGANPGGQVVGWPLAEDVPMELRNRLLSRDELKSAGLWAGTVGERGGWESFL